MNKIGIDFGTSYCTASWINPRTKQPEAITFHEIGHQKMPSVVYYSPNGVVVGLAAYNQVENSSKMSPEHRHRIVSSVVTSIKRMMKQGQYFYLPDGKVSHEEIIAEILRKIREDTQLTCFNKQLVEHATITHPVVFASWQKEMLKKAAAIAGFTSVKLLEEPVAAALGYTATTDDKAKNILVYDFGGGTFDVAFVQCDTDGEYRVPIEPEGEAECGGDDIDKALYDRWDLLAKEKYNRSIDVNPANRDIGFLATCRKHKESMLAMPENTFSEMLPPPGNDYLEMHLDRTDYDKIIEPIIDKTITRTERLLKKIKDAGYKIDTAILIGGSSRIPLVFEKLKKILPVEPRKVMHVDVAVALGAIMYEVKLHDAYCIYCGFKHSTEDRFCIICGRENVCYEGNKN
jgi:molecular chaperone DnaK (HSP70)